MDILCSTPSYQKLHDTLRELCSSGFEDGENWQSHIVTAFNLAESLHQTLCIDLESKNELEKLVVQLWNKAVVLKNKGNIKKADFAKLRHVSYQVTSFLNEASGDITALRKQVLIGLRTTRLWIDLKEYLLAEKVLKSLQETLQKLQRSLIEKKNAAVSFGVLDDEIKEHEKNIFCVSRLKAEVNVAQGQNDEAIAALRQAKELLPKFPSEVLNLSMLCYNFGVDCYHSKQFSTGISWLKESYSIHKDIPDASLKAQSRTLRLLANCYMESKCDNWKESALNAVTLANEKYCHVAGLYVRLQLLLESEDPEPALQHGFQELLDHASFDLGLCTSVLRLLKNFQRSDAAFEIRQTILQKFERHPERGSLLVSLLELFLSSSDSTSARIYTEECITAHNTGQRLEGTSLKQFHIMLWTKAASYFEKEQYNEAVTWYNYSLSLYSSLSVSEPNLAKLQRNIANCYLHLGEPTKAAAAIEIAERCDSIDGHTQFIMFKVALIMDDTEKAMKSLRSLVDCLNSGSDKADINILCLVAHTALEENRIELATVALESLIHHSDKDKQILTSLQCLLRLQLDRLDSDIGMDKKSLLCHLRTANNKILAAKDRGRMASAEVEDSASWFMKCAWNLALQYKDDPFFTKECFNLCSQLLYHCQQNVSNFQRHQKCVLMSCAACLQLSRQKPLLAKHELQILLEEVLQHIEEYKQTERRAQNTLWSQGPEKAAASTEVFLLLYEFEALAKLQDARVEAVLDKALGLANPTPKLFHTFSVLALDAPANNKRLSVRALKIAIRLHLQVEEPDFVKCCADMGYLISLSLACNEKEALLYFKETLDILEKRAKDKYPENELMWLMTKAWNWGIQHYNSGHLNDAEQWCSLSLSMLRYLPSTRQDYQDQMTSVYGEILNALEKDAGQNRMEEWSRKLIGGQKSMKC